MRSPLASITSSGSVTGTFGAVESESQAVSATERLTSAVIPLPYRIETLLIMVTVTRTHLEMRARRAVQDMKEGRWTTCRLAAMAGG